MKRVFTRFGQVLLALVVAVAMLIVCRWLLAKSRVDAVAAHTRVAVPSSSTLAIVAPTNFTNGDGTSAADVAPMYVHAIAQYRQRSVSDLVALPPFRQPLTDVGAQQLKLLADGGNARAACVLAAKVSKCTFWPEVGAKELRKREVRLATLNQQGETGEEMTRLEQQITGTKRTLARIAEQCSGYSPGPEDKAWKYLLQSALQGFEPAMQQFHAKPMFDPSDIGDSVDALVAYKTYAGPFIEALAQAGDESAIFMAHRGYAGLGAYGVDLAVLRVLPKAPARALAYAYVREDLQRKRSELFLEVLSSKLIDASPADSVTRHEADATPAERQWARQFADQLLAGFDSRVFAPPRAQARSESETDRADRLDTPEKSCREN
jgi:hypothetical protein